MSFLSIRSLKSLRRLYRRGFSQYRRRLGSLILLGFLSGILEGVGINAAIPLFSFAIGGAGGGEDRLTQLLRKTFEATHVHFSIRYLLVLICLLFILRAGLLLLANYYRLRLSYDYEERARNEVFAASLNSNWSFLMKQKMGHLETMILTNIRYGGIFLENLSSAVIALTSLVIYVFVAVNISVHITALTLGLGLLMFFAIKPLIANTRRYAQQTETINRVVAHHISENIQGIKTVKAAAVTGRILERGKEYFATLKKLTIKVGFLRVIGDVLMQPLGVIYVSVVFAYAYKSPSFNFAATAAILYLVQRMFLYFQQLQSLYLTTVSTLPYIESILDYQDAAKAQPEVVKGTADFTFRQDLRFDHVSFAYGREGQSAVLKDVSFRIAPGQTIGLIGPSGSGKSTLVDLVLRLLEPEQGEILLDGKNIQTVSLTEWRKHIGYVSQDMFLMNDTIANNIRFYQDSVTEKDIVEAAKKINIHDFVDSLPNKYDTLIGERGTFLSVGQRQRVIMARVLARRPEILILDEATSALDNESEAHIQKVIENLKGKITVLIIAHRLSTVMGADKIIVLSKGKIIEEDSPEVLMQNPESYLYKTYNVR